jgi:hypothetical protein
MAEQQKALARSQFKPPAHAAKSSSKKPVQTTRRFKKLTQNTHAKNRSKSPCKKLMQKSHRGPL